MAKPTGHFVPQNKQCSTLSSAIEHTVFKFLYTTSSYELPNISTQWKSCKIEEYLTTAKVEEKGLLEKPKVQYFWLVSKPGFPSYHSVLRNVTKLGSYSVHASDFAGNTKEEVTQSLCSQKKGK